MAKFVDVYLYTHAVIDCVEGLHFNFFHFSVIVFRFTDVHTSNDQTSTNAAIRGMLMKPKLVAIVNLCIIIVFGYHFGTLP